MPEAGVDEYDHSLLGERDVCTPPTVKREWPVHAVPQSRGVQPATDGKLRPRISAPVGLHRSSTCRGRRPRTDWRLISIVGHAGLHPDDTAQDCETSVSTEVWVVSLSRSYEVAPRAARLTNSMRDIGYDFPTAIADLIDNSITAGATRVEVDLHHEGEDSHVTVIDNGSGMTANGLNEALRFGSNSIYTTGDLGRFGLGLKTASLSQCRRVSVVSRINPERGRISCRTLDLDIIEDWDEWLIVADASSPAVDAAKARLASGRGTAVIWESMDRVLPASMTNNGWGRRRLAQLAERTAEHISMVFHRFLAGEMGRPLSIAVNGRELEPWDPFARCEPATTVLEPVCFELPSDQVVSRVWLHRYILPPRDSFSAAEQFERLSGPLKWNRQQGIYMYRAGRLVQSGGWNGIRGLDEHTKLARCSLEFVTDLDHHFQVNVAKMRINLPPTMRQMLERPIHELCIAANNRYRRHGGGQPSIRPSSSVSTVDLSDVGLAIRSAALEAGHLSAIAEVEAILRRRSPNLSRALGFT